MSDTGGNARRINEEEPQESSSLHAGKGKQQQNTDVVNNSTRNYSWKGISTAEETVQARGVQTMGGQRTGSEFPF